MSALVKLVNDSQITRYLNLQLAQEMEASIAPSRRALQLQGTPYFIKQTGEDKGAEVAASELKGKSRYLVEVAQLKPFKYQALIHVNPELNKLGILQPSLNIAEPNEETIICYTFQPFTNCDLTDLPWHVRIYLLD